MISLDGTSLTEGDPGGALRSVASLPEQIRTAARIGRGLEGLPDPEGIRAVVCCGMGGSGVGGDVLAAVAHEVGTLPVVAHHSYGVPAYCGPETFVIAASYSGGTEETLDAFRSARAAGAWGVAVTSGGTLGREATDAGWAVAPVADGLMPRYAVGWMTVLPAAACQRMGFLRLPDGWDDAVVRHLESRLAEWGPEVPEAENPAKRMARALTGAFPVVWGGDGASGVAAVRWKNDINENAKTFAHAATLPEGDHNEIVGWAREGSDGRPGMRRVLVWLRESVEDPRVAARIQATRREVEASFDDVVEVVGEGDGPLQRFFDLALLGGFVSVYLAIARGVDPIPIESIVRLKNDLQTI